MAPGGSQTTVGVTVAANMDVSGILSGVKSMQGAFNGLKLPANMTTDILKDFNKLQESLKKFESIAKQDHFSKTDLKTLEKLQKEIDSTFGNLKDSFNDLSGQKFYLEADYTKIKEARAVVDELKADIQSKLSEIKIDFSSTKGGTASLGLEEMIAGMERGVKTSKVLSSAMGEVRQSLQAGNFSAAAAQLSQIITKSNDLKGAGTGLLNLFKQWGLIDFSTPANELVKTKQGADLLAVALGKIVPEISKDNEAIRQLAEEFQTAVDKKELLEKTGLENSVKEMSAGAQAAEQLGEGFKVAGQSSREMAEGVSRAADEVKQLQQSTQYFFSLRNMINLLKRGVREAVDVVKELDAAMTETAVVTDYSVGDMWQKLPEYTANANALGATVKDMYEATTLYYQQGLKTDAAMGIANETMKMARIGGLEASDATDKMTAALRGFNMEISEMSAQHVNDVYSNLAAKTASNTEELGTAMQRTASIAHSAGMSFEGTAAFLAQAIETTREPAENLGTAMKTIVARFTELKENPLEITEVDGEEVSYNKVDTALQSIGVSLKDANGQFRDLDKVFLDISKRWDSLTQTQQRYVATTAAGSRQQSRFIAMMSNYERTMQLMDFANNSAGASNEQFGKTMESLEAKLNKLRNAWNEFLMGIMNDSATKFVVDAGTKILDIINAIIDKLSFNGKSGLIKSILSIGTAFTALKAGGNIINKLIGGMGGLVDPTSSFGKGFWGAGKTTTDGTPITGVAGKITTPIVAKLNELIAVTRQAYDLKNTNTQTSSTLGQYKNAFAMLRNTKSLNMGDIGTIFGGLSDEHAYMAYRNTPGTVDAMKQATLGWLNSKGMPRDMQKTGQQLMNDLFKGMSKKQISVKEGTKLLGKPALWGEYFGTDVAKNFSKSFIEQNNKLSAELTEKANQEALKYLVKNPENYQIGSENGRKNLKDLMLNDNMRAAYKERFAAERKKLGAKANESLGDVSVVQQDFQLTANKIGAFGSRVSAAGMSLQMFGTQLGQLHPALQGVGTLLTQVGMAFSTFGTGISAISGFVIKAAGQAKLAVEAVKSAKGLTIGSKAGLFADILTGGMSAGAIGGIVGAVLIGGILIAKNIVDKKAKEAGEEVRKNFEKGFTETNQKIDSLEGYKNRFEELSQGVDRFGHNVSLSAEEYDEYLNIANELKDISPSLIAGYNAEGQAILKKGAALDEVIDKLKEERDLTLDSYITDTSINKLIGEYKTSDVYKDNKRKVYGYDNIIQGFSKELNALKKVSDKAKLDFGVEDAIEQLGGGAVDDLSHLTAAQSSFVAQHYNDILNLIKEKNTDLDEEVEEGFKEAFADLGGAIDDVVTEGQPIIEAMQRWMGDKKLDAAGLALGDEFAGGFTQGFNAIMTQGLTEGWSSEQFKSALTTYSNDWRTLGGETSKYNEILSQATEAQEDYLDAIGTEGAVEDYQNSVEGLAVQLEELAKQYEGTGTAGQFFAEQCLQQANTLRNYATEGVISLGEALNTLSDEFASAREAQERFQKATEGGDYYTAAEGYKSIIETVLDDKNKAAGGSLTGWAGADELLGQDFVDNHNWNQIVNQIEKIQSCFDDGADGIIAFNDLLTENADKLEGLGHVGENGFEFDLQNEDLEEYAKVLGMSEDALAALIDKARQWVPIDLGDPSKIRQAIETSEYSMAGTSSKGKSLVYTSESQFRTEARQQGIRGDDYTKTKKDAESRGVRFLSVENLTAKKGDGLYADKVLENIGLKGADKTLDNAVAAFSKMGFDLEDTKQILTADGIKLAEGPVTDEQVEQAYKEQEFALENPTVAGIADNTGIIASAATSILASMGILTDEAKQKIEETTSKEAIEGAKQTLNPTGGFKTTTERDAARSQVEARIADYESTISLLKQSGNEALQPYIDQLTNARDQLQSELDTEAESWKTKLSEASELVKGIGTESEQAFLSQRAIDIQNIASQEDITEAASALRQLEEEGQLSHSTMAQLAADFLQLRQNDLVSLDTTKLDSLCTTLGLTKDEATELLDILHTPFSLEGRIEGEDLVHYIQEYDGLNDVEKGILLRADTTGEEKVTGLINVIDQEFGDGTEETKTIFLQAEAKMAGGDVAGAEKLLADAGFNEDQVKEITQKLSITVNGTVANKDEVQNSLTSQLNDMNLNAEVKANVSAKLNVKNQKANLNQTGTINYKSKVDSGAVNQAKKTAASGASMPIKAVDKASSTIQSIRNKAGKSVSFNVSPNFTGTWTKTLTIKTNRTSEKDARGRGFSIPAHQTLSFGSAARGMNLPIKKATSKKQVTALVGEEGYEVGYIPSEGRSIIFGANGPEMTAFPSDTIIYPHKQSKEILRKGKNKHQTADSFKNGKDTISSGGLLSLTNSGSSSSSSKKTKTKAKTKTKTKSKNKTSSAKNINNFSVEEIVRFNIDKNLTDLTEAISKRTKEIEKALGKIGTTYKDIADSTKTQITALQSVKDYNQQIADSYQRQIDDYRTRQAKISYTNSKGKSVDKTINIADFTTADGLIDQKKIDKYAQGTDSGNVRALSEAVFKEVSSIKTLTDGFRNAQKAIDDANNSLEDLYKKNAEAFYLWENELTEVYDLTQQIAAQTAMQDRFAAQVSLELARLSTGFGDTAQSIAIITKTNERNNQTLLKQIQTQKTMIEARERELDAFATGTDELEKLIAIRNRGVGTTEGDFSTQEEKDYAIKTLEQRLKAVELARNYFIGGAPTKNQDGSLTYSIDWDKFNKDALNGYVLNAETAKSVKDYFEKLNSANVDYNNAIKENTDTIKATYDKLKEYQDYIVNFEDTLLQQLDEQIKKEIDGAEKLGSTITASLKDLLDEVKRKLDERRKQEDNAKTERDISQKQQRLAALRADTSGGHQVEIAQLQKEIAEAQQSYGRTLEDQLLDRLQQQGDEAAKQRERQIELAQAQLDINSSNNKELVNMWLKDPTRYKDEIKNAWMEAQDYDSKGLLAQQQLNDTFNSSFAELVQATTETAATQDGSINTIIDTIVGFGDKINTQPESELTFQQQVSDALNNISNALAGQNSPLQDVAFHNTQGGINSQTSQKDVAAAQSLADKGATNAELKQAGIKQEVIDQINRPVPIKKEPVKEEPAAPVEEPKPDLSSIQNEYDKVLAAKRKVTKKVKKGKGKLSAAEYTAQVARGQELGKSEYQVSTDFAGNGKDALTWVTVLKAAKAAGRSGKTIQSWTTKPSSTLQKAFKTVFKKKWGKFATGGIADYTGPAWLDGTPSKPELVLNSTDTKNFLALRDVLDKAISSTNSVSNSYGGDTMYEININVDHLNNDYDVDKVVEKVKKEITKGAGYRNVTQVRNFR